MSITESVIPYCAFCDGFFQCLTLTLVSGEYQLSFEQSCGPDHLRSVDKEINPLIDRLFEDINIGLECSRVEGGVTFGKVFHSGLLSIFLHIIECSS